MPAAGLHCDVLLCSDHVRDRRALQRGAYVEAPQFLERVVVIRNHPAVLQGCEDQAACCVRGAGSDFDVGHGFGDHFVVDCVERGHRAVVEVAVEDALLAVLAVDAAVGGQIFYLRAVLREAAFDAYAVGDVFDWIVGGGLVRDAAVEGGAGALLRVST